MVGAFLTIGHSTRPLSEFMDMLTTARVGLLIDVRTFPHSPRFPDYDIARLPDELALVQIGYRHCPDLGGRRGRQKDVPPDVDGMWKNASFHNYADYALGPQFGTAFAELLRLGQDRRVAIMCAEAVWWRCHRRIITDYLLAAGQSVDHLMGPGQTRPATMTPGAVVLPDGKVTYPAA